MPSALALVIDLQLCAAFMLRFALDEAARHARSARAISQRLGLAKVQAIVLLFLGEIYALRRENPERWNGSLRSPRRPRLATRRSRAAPGREAGP